MALSQLELGKASLITVNIILSLKTFFFSLFIIFLLFRVALQTWVMNVFTPLAFLGTVYGSIIQALVDIKNLSGNYCMDLSTLPFFSFLVISYY